MPARTLTLATVAALAAAALAGCGGSAPRQDANEPSGRFPVAVAASFPAHQRLAQRTRLVIAVRNTGRAAIPNVAVTICNVSCGHPAAPGQGTGASAFAAGIESQPNLATTSRPLWIVLRGPGRCGFSCLAGGAGAAATAHSNTWALGRLAPWATTRFEWLLTAVTPGLHLVAWQVAAGLNGRAVAVLAGGAAPQGTLAVRVSRAPERYTVTPDGRIVSS